MINFDMLSLHTANERLVSENASLVSQKLQLLESLSALAYEVQAYGLTNPGSETILAAMNNALALVKDYDKEMQS